MDIRPQIQRLLDQHLACALSADVRIPDCETELNWHAFLGHHDFWRFRGDLFALHGRGGFVPLRRREPPMGVEFLAAVWRQLEAANPEFLSGRQLLSRYQWSRKTPTPRADLQSDLANGGEESRQFLGVWREFGSGTSRSYAVLLYDSAVLGRGYGSSFRTHLEQTVHRLTSATEVAGSFPRLEWRTRVTAGSGSWLALEDALAEAITCDFAVGLEVARYLFCDWLLDFWHQDHTFLFDSYKHDENAERFGGAHKWYCDRPSFLGLCHTYMPEYPPRVLNECIWLHQNKGCRCLERFGDAV